MTDLEEAEQGRLASGRSCGSCSLCCKLLAIAEFAKPRGQWCTHCKPGHGGCSIYDGRPQECRTFYCVWLGGELGPEWYPQHSKMVVTVWPDQGGTVFCITVDPAYPGRWREEPYYSQIKSIASQCLHEGNSQTLVRVGRHYFAIYPSSEVDIGEVDDEVRFPPDRIAAMHAALAAEFPSQPLIRRA